ncbi:hypothetical protein Tco_0412187 [Tanacetum coccineum]
MEILRRSYRELFGLDISSHFLNQDLYSHRGKMKATGAKSLRLTLAKLPAPIVLKDLIMASNVNSDANQRFNMLMSKMINERLDKDWILSKRTRMLIEDGKLSGKGQMMRYFDNGPGRDAGEISDEVHVFFVRRWICGGGKVGEEFGYRRRGQRMTLRSADEKSEDVEERQCRLLWRRLKVIYRRIWAQAWAWESQRLSGGGPGENAYIAKGLGFPLIENIVDIFKVEGGKCEVIAVVVAVVVEHGVIGVFLKVIKRTVIRDKESVISKARMTLNVGERFSGLMRNIHNVVKQRVVRFFEGALGLAIGLRRSLWDGRLWFFLPVIIASSSSKSSSTKGDVLEDGGVSLNVTLTKHPCSLLQLVGMREWKTHFPWHVTLTWKVVPTYGKAMRLSSSEDSDP